jgi:hypothetical protein
VDLAILDEGAGRAAPTTVAALAELARGGLRPETGWFVNLAAVPRAQPARWARLLRVRTGAQRRPSPGPTLHHPQQTPPRPADAEPDGEIDDTYQ